MRITINTVSTKSGAVQRSFTLKRLKGPGIGFQWERDAEGWLESAELLDGLLDSGFPGHQYLAEGDALLEIDFMEHVEESDAPESQGEG